MNFSFEPLRDWFTQEKRDFPWRKKPTPYGVWVSEVMLQQTRASVVIPYYLRWMERFPSVHSLANTSIEEVIKLWEGLGYYARARALWEGARTIVSRFGGVVPSRFEDLAEVKGLGPYTIGAILSFAFHQKAPAVDGNVLRVVSRFLAIEEEVDRQVIQKKIRQFVVDLLPDREPWVIMEAVIELGATICTKRPLCERCPLAGDCRAYRTGREMELPKKKKKAAITILRRKVPVILFEEWVLLQKHEGRQVMSGLYEFPYFDEKEREEAFYPGRLVLEGKLAEVQHTFTRYKAWLFPTVWRAEERKEVAGYEWVSRVRLAELPFSSGHRKICKNIGKE